MTASCPTPVPDTEASAAFAGHEKRWVALTSIAAAVLLTGMKLVVGLLTGSLGVLAEAAHSGLDLVAAIITYLAVRFSDRPADAEHLYGHGKIENLSALVETLLLLITCVWIIYEAVERLFFKDVAVDATLWAFIVIIISIVVDVSRSRALMRVARKHGSQALEADALHFSTDVWSSAVVLLGLGLVRLGPVVGQENILRRADAVAALIVAIIVVHVSLRLGRRTIDALLDRAPPGMPAAVEAAVRGVTGVLECNQVRLRQSGNRAFVDLVVGVERGSSVEGGHAVAQAVEDQVKTILPGADVVVHTEPARSAEETVAQRIQSIAVTRQQTVHKIQIAEHDGRLCVELHLEADENLDLGQAHDRAHELEAAIRAELPMIDEIVTHIEPHQEHSDSVEDVTTESAEMIAIVRRIAAATPGVVECHDVVIRRSGEGAFLTMHCVFEAGLPVRQVHDISTTLERRVRAAIPSLARITTHPEPSRHSE